MTTVAIAHWRRLNQEGTDRCSLSRVENGWMLTGQAIWQEQQGAVDLTYAVRCAEDWTTMSADVTGTWAEREVALRLACTRKGWTLNDMLQVGVTGCIDIDLSFTPATNLLPLRRLSSVSTEPAPVAAAWLVPDLDRLSRLDQVYTHLGNGEVAYASPNFKARLRVHSTGFVTHYPGLWDGWVDD